ncbi:hypothetical protein Ctob_005218 [Chrysochromulina tobinii]|uniref:ENTH domain-containing protein n=1 Tax=Chrysochromulina tobinii TaxID=1460289 RepID=A0A0M0JQB3_9EUKA|nr:hypothetical protein Ctob_005218 [Chrysochromulina tobinii]|eukprot:KOO28670.1 hypothetical protein Ctob_005218 [Chrysochromulina sp. CCMP291]
MDECKTALYKATTDDPLPPKEKHVLTIVRLAGEEETAAQVDAELTKRLQACRSSASATVAAKALLVLHRVASAGHVASLSQAVRELAAVCCEPQGRHAQGEYVSECAAFMRELCLWGGVGTLRDADGLAGRAWASRTVRELAAELPRLQGLTAVALECASLGRSANGALQALRVEIVEDALCLFRLEANAAATLQAGLMALPPAAVAARGGGALELLETFMMHARRAVALQGALADDVFGTQPTAGLDARALITLLDGREFVLAGRSDYPPTKASGGKGAVQLPFGLLCEAIPRPGEMPTPPSVEALEAMLAVIRGRLGISLRQHKWLLPTLRQPLASDVALASPPAPVAPAYRALLLLHAAPISGNHPRPPELKSFVTRQALTRARPRRERWSPRCARSA